METKEGVMGLTSLQEHLTKYPTLKASYIQAPKQALKNLIEYYDKSQEWFSELKKIVEIVKK